MVILYNPTIETWENINSYASPFLKVFVFDNSDTLEMQIHNKGMVKQLANGYYLSLNGNVGISKALNHTFSIAIAQKFEYIMTMDQDSSFSANTLIQYHEAFSAFRKNATAAVLGMAYKQNVTASNYVGNLITSTLITSGSIFSLEKFKLVGDFDERFFIDWVDDEYCYRCKLKGFNVLEAQGIFLNHAIGQKIQKKHLLTRKMVYRDVHSPLRFYYILRNFLLLKKIYGKVLKNTFNVSHASASVRYRFKNVILYGEGIIGFYYAYRAILDYKKNKFGKFEK